jgi:hypothetical protein
MEDAKNVTATDINKDVDITKRIDMVEPINRTFDVQFCSLAKKKN